MFSKRKFSASPPPHPVIPLIRDNIPGQPRTENEYKVWPQCSHQYASHFVCHTSLSGGAIGYPGQPKLLLSSSPTSDVSRILPNAGRCVPPCPFPPRPQPPAHRHRPVCGRRQDHCVPPATQPLPSHTSNHLLQVHPNKTVNLQPTGTVFSSIHSAPPSPENSRPVSS